MISSYFCFIDVRILKMACEASMAREHTNTSFSSMKLNTVVCLR